MFGIELEDIRVYHVFALGGGALALVALVLSFLLPKGFKVPAAILGTVAGLVAGVGVGVIGMAAFGYQTAPEDLSQPQGPAPMPLQAGGKGMGGMPGKGGMDMGGKGKGKGKGPSPKVQLETLVAKIHQLTDKPLTLTLSDQQRSVIREQLKDLGDKEELSDEDAKTRFDAILGAVKSDQAVLEAAGYRFPQGAGGIQAPPAMFANPFKQGQGRDHLTALQAKLASKE